MVASRVVLREEKLGRKTETLRTESGLGASGVPHVGSLGDVIRAYGVKLALEVQGHKSEFIAFSDDMDGLRRVPQGLPDSLKKYIGHPVSAIPDPYNCHATYSSHMNALLTDAMDRCGVKYLFHSATEDYKTGLFTEQIRKILASSDRVGKIVKEEVGQDKYTQMLPYFPICDSCGRIYTTYAEEFEAETDKVIYACEGGAEIKSQVLRGCGYKGETDIKTGRGKLPWKGEFAARWAALKINFEAHGKELTDSVRVNDRICEEILNYAPPFHVRYELFLDKGGRKMSKSSSALEIITPQTWFKYGPPASLNLLMFKRITGTRNVGVDDIPVYVNELNQLEEVYFGQRTVSDGRELAKLKGLFEYTYFLNPPAKPNPHVPYNLLVYLVNVAPQEKTVDYVEAKLREYGYNIGESLNEIENQIKYASNWATDFRSIAESKIELTNPQRLALEDLIAEVRRETDERTLQNSIFNIAHRYVLEPPDFFKLIYTILLGSPRGPRLGPYIKAMGSQSVAAALERATVTNQQQKP
jgi:lysyl-tRNA synthetase class 1